MICECAKKISNLFVIYINDLPSICPDVHFILYADDANIIVTGTDLADIKTKIKCVKYDNK